MGTPLGGSTATFVPGVKLRTIGTYVDIAAVDLKQVPWKDFVTKEVKIGDDGKPRTQDLVTGLVIGGTGVIVADDTERVVAPDELVSIYFAGHHRWEFIQAQKKLEGGLQVGDVIRIKYDRDEPSRAGNPKKVWSVQIRHPKSEEAARTAKCEEARRQGSATPLDNGSVDDNEPF
jgi:hypothetical protein